jgi:gamma-glutamylcyclotransferase (GGCT)/AIG2-like uncharacterized protein YtfP
MARKFREFEEVGAPAASFVWDKSFHKSFYFFYGTLMDRRTLAKVLGVKDSLSTVRACRITGYHCKLWGAYPALLDGPPDAAVHGVAYEVQRESEAAKLKAYEGENYAEAECRIEFQDGSRVLGTTFKWKGDSSVLREGTFDLKDWQMRELV